MKAIRAKSKAASSNKLSHLISRYGGKKRPAEMGAVEGKAAKQRLDRPGRKASGGAISTGDDSSKVPTDAAREARDKAEGEAETQRRSQELQERIRQAPDPYRVPGYTPPEDHLRIPWNERMRRKRGGRVKR